MHINCHLIDGRQAQIQLEDEATLGDLRLKIKRECFNALDQSIRIIFRGRVLTDDSRPLGDLGVSDGSAVHVILAPVSSSSSSNSPAPSSSVGGGSGNGDDHSRLLETLQRLETSLGIQCAPQDVHPVGQPVTRESSGALLRRLAACRALFSHRYLLPVSEFPMQATDSMLADMSQVSQSLMRVEKAIIGLARGHPVSMASAPSSSAPQPAIGQVIGDITMSVMSAFGANGGVNGATTTLQSGGNAGTAGTIISGIFGAINQAANGANFRAPTVDQPEERRLFDSGLAGEFLHALVAAQRGDTLSYQTSSRHGDIPDLVDCILTGLPRKTIMGIIRGHERDIRQLQPVLRSYFDTHEVEALLECVRNFEYQVYLHERLHVLLQYLDVGFESTFPALFVVWIRSIDLPVIVLNQLLSLVVDAVRAPIAELVERVITQLFRHEDANVDAAVSLFYDALESAMNEESVEESLQRRIMENIPERVMLSYVRTYQERGGV